MGVDLARAIKAASKPPSEEQRAEKLINIIGALRRNGVTNPACVAEARNRGDLTVDRIERMAADIRRDPTADIGAVLAFRLGFSKKGRENGNR